jgi:hypothetical protein
MDNVKSPGGRRASARGYPPGASNPVYVYVYVGSGAHLRRTLLGLSQDKLGQALGLTFQQVQKRARG